MAINFSKLFGRAVEPEAALDAPDTSAAHDRYANMEVSHLEQPAPAAEGIMVWNGEPVSHGTLNVQAESSQEPDYLSADDNLRSSAPPRGLLPFSEQGSLVRGEPGAHATLGEAGEGPSTLLDLSHGDAAAAEGNDIPMSLNFENVVGVGDHGAGGHEGAVDGHHGGFDHGHHGLADHHIDFDL